MTMQECSDSLNFAYSSLKSAIYRATQSSPFIRHPATMAPLDIPFHWKQIEEKLENIHQEGEEEADIVIGDSDESDSDDWSEESDSDEVFEHLLDDEESEVDTDPGSFEFYILREEETPQLPEISDVRRRLFEISSGEEDDDGVAYLSD